MAGKPSSWFRFSLRTMFVVVTAICCWLAWESNIVHQRKAELRELRLKPGVQVTTVDVWLKNLSPSASPPRAAKVSLIRQWLGDEAIQSISCARGYHHLSQEQLDRLARIFPEAEVHEYELALEPCHPGCFPRGTLVDTPQGPRPIESIQPGDAVTVILPSGDAVSANVQSVFVTSNRLWRVETETAILFTTETQPLAVALDSTASVGDLPPEATILRRVDRELRAEKLIAATRTDRLETVFNLVLGNRELFIANGYLARSKPPAE